MRENMKKDKSLNLSFLELLTRFSRNPLGVPSAKRRAYALARKQFSSVVSNKNKPPNSLAVYFWSY